MSKEKTQERFVGELANKTGRANRRPASPFEAGREFGRASCAPPFLSAAVAHLGRWA